MSNRWNSNCGGKQIFGKSSGGPLEQQQSDLVCLLLHIIASLYKFGVFVKFNSYGIHTYIYHIYIYIHIHYIHVMCTYVYCTLHTSPRLLNDYWKIFQLGNCLQLTGVNSWCSIFWKLTSKTEMCSMGLEYLPTNLTTKFMVNESKVPWRVKKPGYLNSLIYFRRILWS